MKIENYLQPNCSDLVLMLTGPDERSQDVIVSVIKRIQKLKLDIGIGDWEGQKPSALNPETLALIMKIKENEDSGLTNIDKLMLVKELRKKGMPESDINTFLSEVKEDLYLYVMQGKNSVYFHLSDGYGNDGICVAVGDCELSSFPILKKLRDEFGSDVYPVDGGHTGNWEEFLGKGDKDE
jgi:hypothetical protein